MDIEKHKHLLFIGDPRGTSDGSALYLGITRTLKNHFVVPTDFMLWHKKDRIVDTDLFTKELLEAEMAALKKAEVVLVDMAHPHIHSGIMVAHAIHEKKEIYLLHNMDSIADPLSSPLLLYNGANIPQNRWFKYTSASELYPQLTKIIELEKHVSELETSNLVKSFLIEHKLYCLRQVLSMTESQWKALKPSGKVNLHMGNLLRRYNLQDLVLHSGYPFMTLSKRFLSAGSFFYCFSTLLCYKCCMELSKETKRYLDYIQAHPIASLTEEQFSGIYADLIGIIGEHNKLYYIESNPVIADAQYDELFAYLKSAEEVFPHMVRYDSPTQRLTYQLQESFSQAEHKVPLLSLENSYDADDLKSWDESLQKLVTKTKTTSDSMTEIADITYTCEPKYDGISIELIYERGQFIQAITRGDGYVGEDITENVKTVLSVPYYLKDTSLSLRVRGEIVMTKKAFERVNKEREQAGEALFANPRNATSGSLRQLDTAVTAKRGLICYVYQILEGTPTDIETHEQSLELLKEQGFLVFPWLKHCTTIQSVINLCTDVHTKQTFDKQEIDFDGIVIKINDLKLRDMLGETNHHPRWAMAYKFPAKQVVTKLMSVDWQVGRTGILTPTANLEAVLLGGVTISRASLHNADFIKDKDIKLGDSVWIQRSGEVIPYVVAPVTNARTGEESEIQIPQHCPVCKTDVVWSKTDIHIYCPNATCPAQIKGKLAYWVSRDAMNIDGIGDSIIELVVDQGLVRNVADLYTLELPQKRIQLMAMPLIGQRKFQLIAEELKKSKNNALRRVINGLGIQHIGKKTAQIIVEAISAKGYSEKKDFSIDDLERLLTDEEFLLSIKGIGAETIIALRTWFSNEDNKNMLEELRTHGVNFGLFDLRKKVIEGKLSGQSFCITGTFEIPRKMLAEILTKHGAIVVENITQATHFLIVGNDSSSKVEKATEYNIPLIEGLEKLEQRFPFLADEIEPMKLFAAKKNEKKKETPKQQGLF